MIKYYLLIVLVGFLSAVSQIFLNVSANKNYNRKYKEYLNPWVIFSYCLLFITIFINIYCLKYIDLKNANAINSCSYVFALFLSCIFLKEKLSIKKLIGNALIVLGIIIFFI